MKNEIKLSSSPSIRTIGNLDSIKFYKKDDIYSLKKYNDLLCNEECFNHKYNSIQNQILDNDTRNSTIIFNQEKKISKLNLHLKSKSLSPDCKEIYYHDNIENCSDKENEQHIKLKNPDDYDNVHNISHCKIEEKINYGIIGLNYNINRDKLMTDTNRGKNFISTDDNFCISNTPEIKLNISKNFSKNILKFQSKEKNNRNNILTGKEQIVLKNETEHPQEFVHQYKKENNPKNLNIKKYLVLNEFEHLSYKNTGLNNSVSKNINYKNNSKKNLIYVTADKKSTVFSNLKTCDNTNNTKNEEYGSLINYPNSTLNLNSQYYNSLTETNLKITPQLGNIKAHFNYKSNSINESMNIPERADSFQYTPDEKNKLMSEVSNQAYKYTNEFFDNIDCWCINRNFVSNEDKSILITEQSTKNKVKSTNVKDKIQGKDNYLHTLYSSLKKDFHEPFSEVKNIKKNLFLTEKEFKINQNCQAINETYPKTDKYHQNNLNDLIKSIIIHEFKDNQKGNEDHNVDTGSNRKTKANENDVVTMSNKGSDFLKRRKNFSECDFSKYKIVKNDIICNDNYNSNDGCEILQYIPNEEENNLVAKYDIAGIRKILVILYHLIIYL